MAGPVGCLAAAGAQQQLAGLGMNLRGLGHTVLGWAGPAADFCANATYEHRLDNPDEYNYCSVPGGGPDAFLFAALAVLLACCLHFSSLSAVWVLVAGAIAEGLVFPFNLGRLGNAFTLWLGIDPPEVFFYAFLPPLLLDSALSIDYFLFHKVMPQVFVFAFLVVILSAFLTTPVLLYVLGLAAHGWRWQHGALFSAMLASTDALAISAVLRHASGPESLVTLLEGESLLNDASGIVLFDLFRRLVLQLPEGGEGREDAPSLLSVLPLLGAEVARLAAGGVAVGLVAGALTRRLLRVLRWHGASTSQEVAAILAGGYLVFYTANSPLQVSGVIAVVVYGLYGNAYSHFELGSSRHMHELAAVQGTVAFALNGIVFFFAGASAVNFLIRAVEQVADYRHSFALFPPIYLALVLIRGLCIALFNPLFRLLGRQALPARAVLFVTWGGLRGAISLIMVQAIATDDKVVSQARLVSAQMALWASLFVLSTLLVNAPSVPAVLRFTGLDQVSPVKLRIREKAKRALLRYTAAAIQDLKADEDEMLRGVDWATVASYVDLSEELSLFDSSTSGAAGQPGDQGPGGQQDAQQQEHHGAEARAAAPATLPAQAAASQLQEGEGLFESPGWAAPSAERGSTGRRRAAALSALGNVSTNLALNSSRRLLGASYANLTQKWESRSPHAPAAADASAEDTAEEGGSSGEGEDLEAPLLPSAGAQQARRDAAGRKAPLRRISSVTSISSSSAGGMGTRGSVGGSKDMGSARSRAPGTEGLSKYGSGDLSDEAPFWSGQATAPQAHRLAGAKSAPLMHAIVEVGTSSEEESADSDGEGVPWQASQAGPQPGRQPSEAPPPRPLLLPEDSSNALLHSSPPRQHHQPLHTPHQHTPLQTPRQQAPSQQQHFASLDFETGLPSFPSDAAWSVAEPAPPLLTDVGAGTSGLDFELPLPSSPRRATAGRAADTNQLEAFVQPATPVAAPAPVLPPLRLGRASAPLPDLRTSQAAASGPGSPRQPGSARAAALAGEGGQPSMPLSPRSMHGLVRTSLLPAAADRQAVMHVGELIGGEAEESAARQRQTGMTRIPSLPASPRGQPAAAAAEAPSQPQQTGSWQPQRTLKHTASAGGRLRTGASRLGSGLSSSSAASSGSGGAIFSGLNQPAPARTGLAALFKPPSPGKISPLASAASSPEPAEVGEAPQEKDEVTEPAAEQASVGPAVAQASGGGSRVAAAEQSLLPPLPQLDSLPHPLRSASQPDLAAGTPAEAGDSGAAAPPEMVPDLGEAADAAASAVPPGLPTLPSSAAAAEAASPAQREHARSYSAALPSHEELAVLPDLLVGSPPSHRHFGSSRSQTPAAGAGMAVATAAGSHGSTVKPWQTGAMLLRRSMSTPLSGIAELLEAAGSAGPSTEAGGSPEGGGSPSAAAALHSAASVQSLRWSEEVLAEARTRLVAGLKRYFHSKRGEGLLSAQGLRILSYACDLAIDSQQPLDIWTVAEQEAVGKYRIKLLAWAFFRTKRLTGRLPRWLRWPLMPLLRWVSGMIGSVLSVTMLVASEVAVEYWLALSWSPQAQWLRESQQASPLQEEIARESRRVCKFIIDREIEAPERFQSIQSYRAAMAILRQQSAFIEELYSSGIVNEAEQQAMQEPVQRRARQLEIRGPVWRAPSVREVLRGLPFLTHLAEPLFEALLDRGSLLEFSRGEEIWPGAAGRGGAPSARGLMIVVYGLVRSSFTDPRGAHHEFFLGSGGMLGLLSALTGHPMPGSGPAIAEANALGKGPVAFHLPQSMIRRVRQRAAAGDHDYGQLELDLFRVAGLYVVERLKGQVQAGLAAEYQRYAVDRARRQAISRAAAACAASATRVAGSPPAGPTDKVAAVAAPRVPLSDAEVLGQLDRGRLWRSSQAFARDVLAEIRRQLRDAELVQLAPKQPYRQRSHLLLMQGSLGHTGGAATSSGTRSGGLGKPALPDLSAPAILPWLAGHMQPGPTWAAAAGALPVSQHAAAAAASAPPLTAGSSGALLLACPEPGEGPPSSPSSDSASDLGSPFAPRMPSNPLWNGQQEAQPTTGPEEEAQQGETLDTGGMWAPELEPQPSEAGERRQGRGQPLSPAGRPLHRVRSRRLPISAAWPTLETTP